MAEHLSLEQIDELIRCTAYSYEAGDIPDDASDEIRAFMLGDGGMMNLQDLYRDAIVRIQELESTVVDQIEEEALSDFCQIDPVMTMRGWVTSHDEQKAPSTRRSLQYRKRGKGMISLSFLPNGQLDKACFIWGTRDWEFADGNVLQVLEWSNWS